MPNDTEEVKRLLKENLALTKETNEMLHKMHRVNIFSFWMRILWIAILIGVPVLLYYFVLEPYIRAFGIRTDEFRVTIQNFAEFFRAPWSGFEGE